MDVIISGIKCDHCHYRDDDVQFSEYEQYINKPCPLCGRSLLTQKEYDDCILIYKRVEYLKRLSHKLRWFNPFHYWRLVFGDKRKEITLKKVYKNSGNEITIK